MQQKNTSTAGFANIVVLTAIGLFFIVTAVALFRTSVLNVQTVQYTSGKIDVNNREDAFLRSLLKNTAEGMIPPAGGLTPWSTIMTSAANDVLATSEITDADKALFLGVNAATALNADYATTNDIPTSVVLGEGGTTSPYSGSSAVSSIVGTNFLPPMMNFTAPSGGGGTAEANPTAFLYGATYNGIGGEVTALSAGGRWGLVAYPNIRFGFKNPGQPFIARRIWWRVPVLYTTASNSPDAAAGAQRYPAMQKNYILSLYEIPTQLAISSDTFISLGQTLGTGWGNTTSGNVQIQGNIYGETVQMLSGTSFAGNVSAKLGLDASGAGTIGGQAVVGEIDGLGNRETAETNQTWTEHPASLSCDSGRVIYLPIGNGPEFYYADAGVPTNWELYTRPYYKTRVRILVRSYDPTLVLNSDGSDVPLGVGAINVDVQVKVGAQNPQDAVLGEDYGAGWVTENFQRATSAQQAVVNAAGLPTNPQEFNVPDPTIPGAEMFNIFMSETATNTGTDDRNLLVIDVGALMTHLKAKYGGTEADYCAIYIGASPTSAPTDTTTGDLAVSLTSVSNLSAFTNGLSILTRQRLYLKEDFNQTPLAAPYDPNDPYPPTSLFAPEVRYSITSTAVNVDFTGRVSVRKAVMGSIPTTPIDPLGFRFGTSTTIPQGQKDLLLTDITTPLMIPPITRINWLLVVDEERQ